LAGFSVLLDTLLGAFAGRKGVLRKRVTTLRTIFQDQDLMLKVEEPWMPQAYKNQN